MAAGVGAGLAAVPATAAVTAAKSSVRIHHVAPFGAGAARAVRHVRRHAAAPAVSVNTGTILWVSNAVPVGNDTGCSSPGYATISAALTSAAPGDTIKVCAGSYTDQLAITQSVTLQAHGAVTVTAPASPSDSLTPCDTDGGAQPNQAVVDVCGSVNPTSATITGFTFQGNWPSNICNDSLYGVTVLGGANLTMSNSKVENIGGDPQTDGCQGGVGIEVGLATGASSADPGTATLNNDVVNTYQKNGITVDGTGSNATISSATVTGTGPTPSIAQNGIQISDGATAKITGSTVTGNECNDTSGGCGPNGLTQTQSCGILLFDAGKVTVSGTTASANDIGIDNIEDVTWPFYTPTGVVNESMFGLGLHNRYENAFLDEGKSTLSSSTLSGGEVGIEMDQASYQSTAAIATAKRDTITGATEAAVLVDFDGQAGDPHPKLTVTLSSFDTSNAAGITNNTTSVLNATSDYWGDPSGPAGWSFGSGSSVSADVNFFPWAVDTTYQTLETCRKGLSETATANDQVLCATAGTGNAFLSSGGFNALLIGNKGNDQLNGSSTSETWIIGGVGGTNVMNGENGTGFIQERGNTNDTLINTSGYTVAAN
jgi:hypothetical protein